MKRGSKGRAGDSTAPIYACSAASATDSPPFPAPSVLSGSGRPPSGTRPEASGASRSILGSLKMHQKQKHVKN